MKKNSYSLIKTMNDEQIAKKYISKSKNAKQRGIEFSMSFLSFKNIMRAKKCRYSGTTLTLQDGKEKGTDITVERIDPKKGYVNGNVCAVALEMNRLKGAWEHKFSPEEMLTICKKVMAAKNKNSKK